MPFLWPHQLYHFGTGRTWKCKDGPARIESCSWSAAVDQLRTFLQDLAYCDARAERGHLLQSVAKFRFVNRLGRLTVYPTQDAFDAACEVLQASNRQHSLARCRNDHAFFLPTTCSASSAKTTLREYGGKTQKQVFEGGGPFMIKDSASTGAQALQRMGYLDEVYNSDFRGGTALVCEQVKTQEHSPTGT